jgi:DNA-binding CsgD family transcriptional regulator
VFDAGRAPGQVYRLLVGMPGTAVADLAARCGFTEDALLAALAELEEADAVFRSGSGWEAQSPERVAEAQVRRAQDRITAVRAAGDELAQLYRDARREGSDYPGIEVVHDRAMVLAHFEQLQLTAQHVVRAIDRPPYISGNSQQGETEQFDLQAARMAAGVRYRTIYHHAIYDDPDRSANMIHSVSRGEQARILPEPPMKLLIADDDRALLPLDPAEAAAGISLVVHRSGLLDALLSVFETLWRLAVPVTADGRAEQLDPRSREILTLMAAGATDEAIARRVGLSRRSVVRQTSMLLERLGATTRFQAGVQAARRGWL